MALTTTSSGSREIETYFLEPSWETKTLKSELRRFVPQPVADEEYSIYAKTAGPAGVREIQIAKWTYLDLYSYSQAPIVDLANFFGVLMNECQKLSDLTDVEFEIQTVRFWTKVRKLVEFFGISDAHDELITSFQLLSVGYNGLLDMKKIGAIINALTKLQDVISLTDNVLDEILDSLEMAGFDLKAPITFSGEAD
jgi:hypothetical protein